MSQALQNLLDLLDLEKIEEGLFRGQSEDLGLRQVFGGQVVGQALYAAKQTVPDERSVHSFHSYFLRPGDSSKPIVYDVETLRDGNSFSARRVSAIQHGKPIFYMTASFQSPEAGFEHQNLMPDVPPPEGLLSESEIAQKLAHMLPEKVREKFIGEADRNAPGEIPQPAERQRGRTASLRVVPRQRQHAGRSAHPPISAGLRVGL